MAKNMKDKKIIKIFIAGETKIKQKYIKDLPLSKELFSKILDCIDFNRQILIVENVTCLSAGYLMPSDKLLQEDGKYSHVDPSPIDDDDQIVNLCKKKLQNDRQCFYYGAVDPTLAFAEEICFIQRHSSSIDGERIVLRPNIALDAEANKKYINCLYNDILSLKTSQTNNDINNNSLMTNNQHNIPTYQSEMGNNKYNFGIQNLDSLNINSLQTQRQSDAVNNNQNGDNINASMSFDSNEFCNLTNCTCCGYKLCNPE